MPTCQKVRARHRKMCVGDLEHEIQVVAPELLPPNFQTDFVDYRRDIDTDNVLPEYAMIETRKGLSMFDGTGIEQDITHIFGIYYNENYTSEFFVLKDNRYFRVIRVEDLEDRHEWMFLYCAERGTVENTSNRA